MSVEITFKDTPCRFYWWIGSPVCDACGKPSSAHEGMAIPEPGSSPFGAANKYLGLTWAEWEAHCEASRRATEARRALAALSDSEAVALATVAQHVSLASRGDA